MLKKISKRDKVWLAVLLGNVLYFFLLELSRCQWVDGPLAFVHGCHNYGIDWNSFMAPIGMIVVYFGAQMGRSELEIQIGLIPIATRWTGNRNICSWYSRENVIYCNSVAGDVPLSR